MCRRKAPTPKIKLKIVKKEKVLPKAVEEKAVVVVPVQVKKEAIDLTNETATVILTKKRARKAVPKQKVTRTPAVEIQISREEILAIRHETQRRRGSYSFSNVV